MFSKADIEKYFIGERHEAMLFIIVGIMAALIALVFFFYNRTLFFKGFAIPLLLVAVIQCVVGYTVYSSSDKQRTDLVYAYDMDPVRLKNEELPRLEKVMKGLVRMVYLEIALLIVGLILFFIFRSNPEKVFFYGLSMGLLIQAIICLVMDGFAYSRSLEYMSGLLNWLNR